ESTGARHLYAAGGLYRFPADPCLAGRGERAALSWGHASAGIVRRRACPGPERGPIRHLSKVGAVNGNLPPPLVCGGGAFESLDDRRVTAVPRYERALALLAGPAAASGDFMQIAAQALSVGLGCRCAGVVVRSDDGRTARTLSWWLDGEWQPPLEYALSGTPCADVYSSPPPWSVCIPEGVQEQFPDDPFLAELEAMSYWAEIGRAHV